MIQKPWLSFIYLMIQKPWTIFNFGRNRAFLKWSRTEECMGKLIVCKWDDLRQDVLRQFWVILNLFGLYEEMAWHHIKDISDKFSLKLQNFHQKIGKSNNFFPYLDTFRMEKNSSTFCSNYFFHWRRSKARTSKMKFHAPLNAIFRKMAKFHSLNSL